VASAPGLARLIDFAPTLTRVLKPGEEGGVVAMSLDSGERAATDGNTITLRHWSMTHSSRMTSSRCA